jgi:glucose-6-phosphate 1-epimerase
MTAGASHEALEFRGQPCVAISLPQGDRILLALQGAHVLSWQTADGREHFYLSPKAVMDGSTAIRGGVPLCFPQFNQRVLGGRALPKHGFVRNHAWILLEAEQADAFAKARLGLRSSPETLAIWPHSFDASLTVQLEPGRLRITFEVQNTGPEAWPFALALHSYLHVSNIAGTQLTGLGGLSYWDGVQNLHQPEVRLVQPDGALVFSGETDRVYADAKDAIELKHASGALRITQSTSLPDTVVWNPAADLCATIKDLPADGWENMVCVEAARINEPEVLAPGQSWSGWQTLESIPATR